MKQSGTVKKPIMRRATCLPRGMGMRIIPSCLLMVLLWTYACIPNGMSDTYDLVIVNQTEETISVYINDVKSAVLGPGQEVTGPIGAINRWDITAKNSQGEIVFSRTITDKEVRSSNETSGKHYVYRIIITETKKPTGSNNTTSGQ